MLIDIPGVTDDAEASEMARLLRRPDGVRGPHRDSARVVKPGREETEPRRQRYGGRPCGSRFDDLTDTIFAGHRPPRIRVLGLYFMGLNLPNEQIANELDLGPDDAQRMTTSPREGGVPRKPRVALSGEVECDE